MRGPSSALAAAALALACGACSEPAPVPELPAGAALVGERAQLDVLLETLAGLEGTPLGRRAGALAKSLPDCPVVEAHAAEADIAALAASLRCPEEGEASGLEGLHESRGAHGVAFVWPLEGGVPLRGWLSVGADGAVESALELPSDAFRGAAAVLLPGDRQPGPGVLSGEESLLHARVRPSGGLDLAALVPQGGQADRMFRLKSELFRGVVLDGTWEAAVYLPGPGEVSPRAVLALGIRQRDAAEAAAEGFFAELSSTWPLRQGPFALGEAEGACLLDLRILPGFAPCYVVTGSALVLGYNPPSLRHALAGGTSPALGDAGGLVVELARFGEADARLAAAAPGSAARGSGPPRVGELRPPWQRARAEGASDGGAVRLQLALDPRAGT